MKHIQKNMAYIASFIFALMGFILTLCLDDIWPFGFACGLDIFIMILDYARVAYKSPDAEKQNPNGE